jgi:hypothetical protein
VVTAEIDLGGPRYMGDLTRGDLALRPVSPNVGRFFEQLIDELKAIPTVEDVGVASWLPMGGNGSGRRDRTFVDLAHPETQQRALFSAVSAGYFTTLRIPLLRGRLMNVGDSEQAPWVAVINRAMADQFWPGENPIGKSIRIDIQDLERPREIVGVVENTHQFAPSRPAMAEMYVPIVQQPAIELGYAAANRFRMSVAVRAPITPALIADMRRVTARIDATQPLMQVRTMDQVVSEFTAPTRFFAAVLTLVAVLGTMLAAFGVFALVSFAAIDRSPEFGVRLALGAKPALVARLLFRRTAVLAALGVVAGGGLAYWVTQLIAFSLYGVTPLDIPTFVGAGLLLAVIALTAALHPARRVLRLDPSRILRC